MGQQINHLFESQMQWSYDNGIFYITGRDVIWAIGGMFFGILIVLIILLILELKKKGE